MDQKSDLKRLYENNLLRKFLLATDVITNKKKKNKIQKKVSLKDLALTR